MDYDISIKNSGKKIGNDFKEGKVTLPMLMAISRSNKKEKEFWRRVIEKMDQQKEDFDTALSIINKYDCLDESKMVAKEYSTKALKITSSFPNNIYNETLAELSSYVFKRST